MRAGTKCKQRQIYSAFSGHLPSHPSYFNDEHFLCQVISLLLAAEWGAESEDSTNYACGLHRALLMGEHSEPSDALRYDYWKWVPVL